MQDVPEHYRAAIEAYRCIGTSIKINLAVSELPEATGADPDTGYQRGIMEVSSTLADMDRAQALAMQGIPAEGAHVEMCIPTLHDPTLAPDGRHIVTIDVNSQPYNLAEGQGNWDDIRERVADRAIEHLGNYFPNLPGSILHRQVLSPLDLERLLGITGGHALHGDMGSDQLFSMRPVPGHGDYRTPVRGPVPVRRRHASRRRCHRRQRPQLRARGAARRQARPALGGRAPATRSGVQPVQPAQVVRDRGQHARGREQ